MDKIDNQLQDALERIAELNRELGRDPNSDPLYFRLTDPVTLAAARLLDEVNKAIKKAESFGKNAKEKNDLAQRILSRASDSERPAEEEYAREAADQYAEHKKIADLHLSVLSKKKELIATNPEQLFLPLGTHVRINGRGLYENTAGDRGVAGEGTEGVVSRLNSSSEYPIRVAFVGPYRTSSGDAMNASESKPHEFQYDREQIDVVAPGLLPDGSPASSYGFTATHICEDNDTEEMIIEARGLFWRFQAGWEERGRIELDKAAASLEDLDDSLKPISSQVSFRR
jgi:hypothetical protein